MARIDEQIRVEENRIKHFERLGYTRYEAIKAVEEGVDWHEVELLLKKNCPPTLAIKITRP
jgi:hypothetical protein